MPKQDVIRECRRLHNEGLGSLYRSHNKINMIKSIRSSLIGHVARMVDDRSAFKILTSRLTGKGPLGRPIRK